MVANDNSAAVPHAAMRMAWSCLDRCCGFLADVVLGPARPTGLVSGFSPGLVSGLLSRRRRAWNDLPSRAAWSMPARVRRRRMRVEPVEFPSFNYGGWSRTNTSGASHSGRPCKIHSATALPASAGSGSTSGFDVLAWTSRISTVTSQMITKRPSPCHHATPRHLTNWCCPTSTRYCGFQGVGTTFHTTDETAIEWSDGWNLGAAFSVKGVTLKASYSTTAQTGYDQNAEMKFMFHRNG
jgi:hypothetical protein